MVGPGDYVGSHPNLNIAIFLDKPDSIRVLNDDIAMSTQDSDLISRPFS
jgi:hypothetical protein